VVKDDPTSSRGRGNYVGRFMIDKPIEAT
jgi:hypothetical protein